MASLVMARIFLVYLSSLVDARIFTTMAMLKVRKVLVVVLISSMGSV